MTTYVLEMRSTADWQDVRYREYSTSARKAEMFRRVPKIQFTDSGHGIVPAVREHSGRREPTIHHLADHVAEAIAKESRTPKRPTITQRLEAALKPFVEAYEKAACPVGDSDLYDEQPRSVAVTLGDCRKAARALHELDALRESPNWKTSRNAMTSGQ